MLSNRLGCCGLLAAGTLFVAAAATFAEQPPVEPVEPAVAVADVLTALGVTDATVVQLVYDRGLGRDLQVQVPLPEGLAVLDLWPHSVRGDRFTLMEQRADGSLRQVDPGPINTLRGVVRGLAGSVVAGGLMADGLYCTIILPDGTQYWVEPLAGRVAGAGERSHALYRNGEGAGFGRCGNEDGQPRPDEPGEPALPGGDGDLPPQRGATMWTAQVATDADYEFYARYGSTVAANNRISLIINTMNLQYERDVDIRHVISASIVRTAEPDPYTMTDSEALLAQMRIHWNANHQSVVRDTAHLFTGKEIDGLVIGRAYDAVICSSVSSGSGYGFSQVDFNGSFMSSTDLVAHELGHNWSACHCECESPPYTMNPSITHINRFGGPASECGVTSLNQIIQHRNSRNCLTTSTPGLGPPNDACSNATLIGPGSFGFGNTNASNDGPATCAVMGADIWYRFIPDCDGTMTVTTCGSTLDTVLVAYSGNCDALVQIACNDDTLDCPSGTGRQSRISFPVLRSVMYRIRVGGFNGATSAGGILNVSVSACAPPFNDHCSNALAVEQGVNIPFSTVGATTDGPLETGMCLSDGYAHIGSDIWYLFTAPCAGPVRVSLCGSSFDTKLAVYALCPEGIPSAIACNDDFCGPQSQVQFNATDGGIYRIRIGGFHGEVGAGILRITALNCAPPPNNHCAESLAMAVPGTTAGTTAGAFASPEAAPCDGFGLVFGGVWYHFTSPGGTIIISTCGGASFDTALRVFTGPCANLACVTMDDDFCDRQSRVAFTSTAGTQYRVYVSGVIGSGPFTLTATVGPMNDFCASAIDVSAGGTFNGTLVGATNDGSAPCGNSAAQGDVWYRFTAPPAGCGGRLVVTTCGTHDAGGPDSGTDTVLSIHADCGGGEALVCNDDTNQCRLQDLGVLRDSRVVLDLSAGQSVRIRVSHAPPSAPGPFQLNVFFGPVNDFCSSPINASFGNNAFCTHGAETDGPSEPAHCNFFNQPQIHNDVWFRITAGCSAPIRINLCDADYDTDLAVYPDVCPGVGGTVIACNDDNCGINRWRSALTIPATGGDSYLIRIGGFAASSRGSGTLVIRIAADWDGNGAMNSTDISAYITSWLASINGNLLAADFNNDNVVNSTDISAFITAWLAAIGNCG